MTKIANAEDFAEHVQAVIAKRGRSIAAIKVNGSFRFVDPDSLDSLTPVVVGVYNKGAPRQWLIDDAIHAGLSFPEN